MFQQTSRSVLSKAIFGGLLLTALSSTAAAQTQDDLFGITVLQEFRLTVNPADWAKFKANYMANDYYPADLTWRGIVMENIGIRNRGTGSRSGVQPYFGLSFAHYVKGQQFLGLTDLRLKNSTQDPSELRERLGMLMFRRMGVPAPRESYTRLYVNDQYLGLYIVVEEIDDLFMDRVFKEHSGCHYNYNWVEEYHFEYLGDDPALYAPAMFEPKSCDANTDPASLIHMIRTINQVSNDAFIAEISKFLDLNLFLKYLAVENFLADSDGVLGYAGVNNIHLYRFSGTERFQFIAWDKNTTFYDAHHSIWHNADLNVLTRRIFQYPELSAVYQNAQRMTSLEAGGAGGWLEQELDRAYTQMHQAALDDTLKPFDNETFENNVEDVRNFVHWRQDYVISQVGPASPPAVSSGGVVSGASYAAALAAGGIGSIFGANLAYTDLIANTIPLPTAIDQTAVQLNGMAVPLLSVSPSQINFQVPWELAGQPQATLTVTVGGEASAPQPVNLAPMAPGLFSMTGGGQGAILISGTGELAAPSSTLGMTARPARRTEFISIYSTGLGSVINRPATGDKPSGGLCTSTTTPIVMIGGLPATVSYSGLASDSAGLYVINAQVPENTPTGDEVPVAVTMGGAISNTVTMAVQ